MINDARLKYLCEHKQMIVPYCETQLQPHSYDCRLGSNFKVPVKPSGDIWRQGNRIQPAPNYNEHKGEYENIDIEEGGTFLLPPLSFALAHTQEVVTVPLDMVGMCAGKSSIARNALIIESAGLLDCEFSGQITLELFNQSPWTLELPVGLAICQVYFHESAEPMVKHYTKVGHYNAQRGAKPAVFSL